MIRRYSEASRELGRNDAARSDAAACAEAIDARNSATHAMETTDRFYVVWTAARRILASAGKEEKDGS